MKYHHRNINHALSGDNTLHVITMISNPVRYHVRYQLHEQFSKHVRQSKEVNFVTVEVAFGDRQFEVTQADNPNHVQLRTKHELWHKENALNVAIRRLPHDWKYVAWVDADIQFVNPNWAQETLHQLQHHPVVQMFDVAVDMGPDNNALSMHRSFAKAHVVGELDTPKKGYEYYTNYFHPGFCWAVRRDFFEGVGGLFDKAILGAGDRHMALAIIGQGQNSLEDGLHPNYKKSVMEWQRKALFFHKNLGYVPGSILHYWHGRKKDRRYHDRWQILVNNQYDPDTDLQYDDQGLLYLRNPARVQLRDELRQYFRQRLEDSLEE